MNGVILSAAIKNTLTAQGFKFESGAANTRFVDAFCDALIQHIQTTAVISVTVAPVPGVTVGAGVSGPTTGVGTIS